MRKSAYSRDFYEGQSGGSLKSARVVVPLVLDLVPARSVCDIGCGVGTWLRAFSEAGVATVAGFDGSWVKKSDLQIPLSRFSQTNLAEPFSPDGRFDLACSLEVAEHLPQASAAGFVATLTQLAPVVLFSAAAPQQGGTEHINEQWPSYWRQLFASRGFKMIDCIRNKIWDCAEVEWWYRQNIFLFASETGLSANPSLARLSAMAALPSDIIHPECYLNKQHPEYFMGNLRSLPRLLKAALARKIG